MSDYQMSRDGVVTVRLDAGKIVEEKVEERTTRYFHDGADHAEQMRGFGYRTKREAAEALVAMVTARLNGLEDGEDPELDS